MEKTIAAISTAMSASGIGIVRISGDEAMDVISRIYRSKNGRKNIREVQSHTIHYGFIYDGEDVVDEVLVMIMRGPHTYTGEDTVEIDCHGGVYAMKKVLETVLKNGAVIAEPGEFTKRAFLNGRLDLSQAEAVMDVIQARNSMALKSSVEQLKGSVQRAVKEIRSRLLYQIAYIESALDDPEHYTTAKELCIIAAYAIQNKEFQKVIQTPQYQFQDASGQRSFQVSNHDAFLGMYQGALGIKTGFTGNAGYCFCGAATKNNRMLVSAVLACGWPPHKTYKWSDTTKLMDYGFEGFKTCEIPSDRDTWKLSVENGCDHNVTVFMSKEDTDSLQLPLRADDVVEIRTSLPEKLTAPVRSGDIVGCQEILLNGEVLTKSSLYTGQDIAAMDFPYVLKHLFRNYVFS